ncbi:pullulanase-type alpha-1,6-glucosidase [Vibrio sp. S4M6]|nr:pullulanase-type alpha-1,6-glucosidase [Vibrio sinus]MCL9783374.1 pullulanase-type alpha-1,6-glucosidase [Vibrio sinus]
MDSKKSNLMRKPCLALMVFGLLVGFASTSQAFEMTHHAQGIAISNTGANANQPVIVSKPNDETFHYREGESPNLSISDASAHWLDINTIAWFENSGASRYALWSRAQGSPQIGQQKEFKRYPLSISGIIDNPDAPYLNGRTAFHLQVSRTEAKALLKTQLLAVALENNGKPIAVTRVQIPGVVDDLYTLGSDSALQAHLGSWIEGNKVHFALWAPTAQKVELLLYSDNKSLLPASPITMKEDSATGVWHYQGSAALNKKYYRYRVKAFQPETDKVENMVTTDPYSLSLSRSSQYSQVVDLTAEETKPAGWDTQRTPKMKKPIENVVYEMHIRDFSASDTQGTPKYNGKYLALTENQRESVQHLRSLQQAGLTTVHLLPTNDLASIPEEDSKSVNITDTVSKLCRISPSAKLCRSGASSSTTILSLLEQANPYSGEAQDIMADIRALDSFNWGYDPYHYTVPEGSYAVKADGISRIREYRQMVQALHEMGLLVVSDVVFNHTYSAGLDDKSVLDKVVPGYYHRLNPITGAIEHSTCCENTASEHRMFSKLMSDSLTTWAREYRIDGFRFDLMGHLMKSSVLHAYRQVKRINPNIWFYGEGWDFAEVANGQRGENATQWNMAGTGIGTYNDRLRDAVRGGAPFDSGDEIKQSFGFANAGDRFDASVQSRMDLIRYGMAGNLQNYPLQTYSGAMVYGRDYQYNGQAAGYTLSPQESINYVSKHDNQTLWDINQYKVADNVSSANRARMQIVALSTVLLGEGVPFLHMGSELLRSKSMERDSYDSGDWFNRVDFSMQTNNWNVGLPRADKDKANWPTIASVISNPNTQASAQDIRWTDSAFKDLLRIRASSPLFKLSREDQVVKRVKFHNTGPDSLPGLIAMSISDGPEVGGDLDKQFSGILVVINANTVEQSIHIRGYEHYVLHPVLQDSRDDIVKQACVDGSIFTVPGLTAAVFVKPR